MCGRLIFTAGKDELATIFGLADPDALPDVLPSWILPPSREVPAIGLNPAASRRRLALMKWGFVPSWWQGSLKAARKPANARGETVTGGLFRDSFRSRQCLVPASGFHEWDQQDRMAFAFRPATGTVFALGAVWDAWVDPDTGERRRSLALVTTGPNELMKPIHDRMPVILSPDDWDAWHAPATPPKDAARLIRPCPADLMTVTRVGPAVGSVKNDGPQLLEPYTPPAPVPDLFAAFT